MKKNFAKKLASVLSLAMVVTMIPATPASAATTPNLTKRYTNVYEGKSYSYAVKDAKGYSVKWVVDGKGAEYADLSKTTGAKTTLTLDTNGETAAKNSNVVVRARFYKNNKLVKTVGDAVKVKVSATAVDAVTAANVDAIPVGEVADFNRKITPANATSTTYWSVTDKDGKETTDATIDKTGNFKATKVGEYVVVAEAKNAKNGVTIAKDTQAVKAVFKLLSANLVTTNKVELKLNAKVDGLTAKDITIVNTESKLKQPVKSITVSEDGLTVTAEAYSTFADAKTYTVTINNSSQEFTAKIGTIASIVMEDQIVETAKETAIKYTVLDENGLDITASYPANKLTWFYSIGAARTTDGKVKLNTKGDAVFVTAKYIQYDTTGKDTSVSSKEAKITAVDATVGSIKAWTIATTADWAKLNTVLTVEDNTQKLWINYVNTSNVEKKDNTGLTFTSLDPQILAIDAKSGLLYPIKAGTVDIKVEATNFVQYITINVNAKSEAAKLDKATSSVALSKAISGVAETANVEFTLKDQYDKAKSATDKVTVKQIVGNDQIVNVKVNATSQNLTGVGSTFESASITDSKFNLEISALAKGSATLLVNFGGKETTIYVTVSEAGAVANYVATVSKSTVDPFKLEASELKVYAVDANNVKRDLVTNATYKVKDKDGKVIKDLAGNDFTGNLNLGSVSLLFGSISKEIADGTYTVEVTVGSSTTVRTATIVVKSSRAGATVSFDKVSADAIINSNIEATIKSFITAKVNGDTTGVTFIPSYYVLNNAMVSGTGSIATWSNTGTVTVVITKVAVEKDSFTYNIDLNPAQAITVTVK